MSSYYEKMLATGEVKCIDEEIPFEVPKGWEWCRLKHICSMQAGKNISANKIFSDKSNSHPYRCVGGNGLRGYTENFNSHGHYSIIGRQGALCGCVNIEKGKFYATEHAVVVDTYEILSSLFMYYFLTALNLNKYATATAQPGLAVSNVLEVMCPLPPLNEGERIIEKLSVLIPLIENYNVIQEKQDILNDSIKEQLKKSILQEAIQGKLVPQIAEEGRAQELLEQIKTEKQKLVKEGKLKKSALNDSVMFLGDDNKYYEQIGKKCLDITEQIPFEIPSNWEWCRVRNVSNSYIGLTYKPTDIDKKGTIVLRSCNIRNGKLALDDIVRVSSSISEKLLIEENDIIICARNGSKRLVGKSALIRNLTEPMTFGAFMAICKTPIYEYMFAYLQSDLFFGQLRDVSNTTTINQLTQNKFNDFLIPIPPVREQERIAFKISQLFQELR